MSNFLADLETIRTAIYGKDMRQAIYDCLNFLQTGSGGGYIKLSLDSVFPEWIKTVVDEIVTEESTLYGNDPYILVPSSAFDPSRDGLLVWRNRTELIPRSFLVFDTVSVPNKVKISFNLTAEFQIGNRVEVTTYEKPYVTSTAVHQIVKITQDDYDSMAVHDANTLYCIVEDAPPAPPIMEES